MRELVQVGIDIKCVTKSGEGCRMVLGLSERKRCQSPRDSPIATWAQPGDTEFAAAVPRRRLVSDNSVSCFSSRS